MENILGSNQKPLMSFQIIPPQFPTIKFNVSTLSFIINIIMKNKNPSNLDLEKIKLREIWTLSLVSMLVVTLACQDEA
jgi:hypothetical protein